MASRPRRRRSPFTRLSKTKSRGLKRLWDWELEALAKVITLHPPAEFPRVADVGGGDGRTARFLRDLGYQVTIIDPHPYGPAPARVKLLRQKFLVRHAFEFDLLVGMRPCRASKKLVRAAKHRPLVLLPCTAWCSHIWPGKSGSLRNIERYFRSLGVGFRRVGRLVWWTGESRLNRYV